MKEQPFCWNLLRRYPDKQEMAPQKTTCKNKFCCTSIYVHRWKHVLNKHFWETILERINAVIMNMLCTAEIDMTNSVKLSDIDVFLSDTAWVICLTYSTVLKALPFVCNVYLQWRLDGKTAQVVRSSQVTESKLRGTHWKPLLKASPWWPEG